MSPLQIITKFSRFFICYLILFRLNVRSLGPNVPLNTEVREGLCYPKMLSFGAVYLFKKVLKYWILSCLNSPSGTSLKSSISAVVPKIVFRIHVPEVICFPVFIWLGIIHLVRTQHFPKKPTFLTPWHVRNVTFSENVAYVLNEWPLYMAPALFLRLLYLIVVFISLSLACDWFPGFFSDECSSMSGAFVAGGMGPHGSTRVFLFVGSNLGLYINHCLDWEELLPYVGIWEPLSQRLFHFINFCNILNCFG